MKTLALAVVLAFFSGMLIHDGYDSGNGFTFGVGICLALSVLIILLIAGVEGFG